SWSSVPATPAAQRSPFQLASDGWRLLGKTARSHLPSAGRRPRPVEQGSGGRRSPHTRRRTPRTRRPPAPRAPRRSAHRTEDRDWDNSPFEPASHRLGPVDSPTYTITRGGG